MSWRVEMRGNKAYDPEIGRGVRQEEIL